ncbi:Muconolactone delta-isomerase [Variovorax paradoxus EPS]|uniref:muconolactone Delta-isomerase n=2 Tax=Variovorax paradoxus TaxID=34073 RepID=E6VAN8_VARPE|nr:Muconolactone delta-isomerase [Variovorax paradoxus EPS]
MQFMLNIDFTMPAHFTPQEALALRGLENAHALALMEQKVLLGIWRVVGRTSNFSLWQAPTLEALHATLSALPMFPFMKIQVTPLIEHPVAAAFAQHHEGGLA